MKTIKLETKTTYNNEYIIDKSIYGLLRKYFGMLFFHREENNKIYIKPISARITKIMMQNFGSENFKKIESC